MFEEIFARGDWSWADKAECKKDWVDPEWFFDPLYEDEAVKVCNDCPVRDACLKHALDQPEIFGVWGGMNERDRRRLLARRARMVHMSREHKPHW